MPKKGKKEKEPELKELEINVEAIKLNNPYSFARGGKPRPNLEAIKASMRELTPREERILAGCPFGEHTEVGAADFFTNPRKHRCRGTYLHK